MKPSVATLLAVTSLLCLAGMQPGQAQSFGPYLKVDGGINLVGDEDLRIAGYGGKMSLDAGYRFDVMVGYELNRWVSLELEGGYTKNSVDKLTLGPLVNSLSGESSFNQIPLLLNVIVRYENQTDFVPYIGAGAGGVMTSLKISDQKDDDTVFAWQGKAGVIYKIDEQAWIDAGYKLLGSGEQNYRIGAVPLQSKQMFSHFFGISVIWKF